MLQTSMWRASLAAAVSLGLGVSAVPVVYAAAAIEEVVVTGSSIKRTTADSPSPLTVVDRVQIEQMGAIEVADIVNRMTFNSGSTKR